jgi:hypothetical protein
MYNNKDSKSYYMLYNEIGKEKKKKINPIDDIFFISTLCDK